MPIRSLLLLLFVLPGTIHAQSKASLKKAWVGPEMAYARFDARRCIFDFFGQFATSSYYRKEGDSLQIYGDNIHKPRRAQKGELRFLIKRLTKDSLILANDEQELRYIAQTSTATDTIRFDSLYFKSSICFGTCPAMEFQVNKNGLLQFKGGRYAVKEGDYTSILSKKVYQRLQYLLSISSLDNIKTPKKEQITDVPWYTIVVWYNNKRMYIEHYDLPLILEPLRQYLMNLPANVNLKESGTPLVLTGK